jgi:RNA polymerase sigma-70 factor (ECF subfamily)
VTAEPTVDDDVRAACAAGEHARAAELVVRAHMREIIAYLGSLVRGDPDRLDDAFSTWCEDVVRGVAGFRFGSSIRTWAYTVARHTAARCARTDHRRAKRIDVGTVSQDVVAVARTETVDYLRTAMKDRLARVREGMRDDERELLHLRVDRQLAWSEVEEIVRDDDAPIDPASCRRREAALRKRFEALKGRLKTQLAPGRDEE